MYKLTIPPDRDGYGAKYGNEVIATDVVGGAPRYRRDVVGNTAKITVRWKVDNVGYTYLQAFFRTGTNHGANPFKIDLVLDGPNPTEYVARFVPDTFALESQSGLTYFVVATLDVEPLADNAVADAALLGPSNL